MVPDVNHIEHLTHFTGSLDSLTTILNEGFKPSYAKETLTGNQIMVAMVSFSNILYRDVGQGEVLSYGDYGVAFSRGWGISKKINPVIYTYDGGLLEQALQKILYSTVFLRAMENYKDQFANFHKAGLIFSKKIKLTNTSEQVYAILDYITTHYTPELVDILAGHAKSIYDTNFPLLLLTKPYTVMNGAGRRFTAYNDREWRKLYQEIPPLFEGDDAYNKYDRTAKPHFHEEAYRLSFDITDLKAIMVKHSDEIKLVQDHLSEKHGEKRVAALLDTKSLIIGTKDMLIANGF